MPAAGSGPELLPGTDVVNRRDGSTGTVVRHNRGDNKVSVCTSFGESKSAYVRGLELLPSGVKDGIASLLGVKVHKTQTTRTHSRASK